MVGDSSGCPIRVTQALVVHADVVIDGRRLQQALDKMNAAQAVLDGLYERWTELEAKLTG